MTMKSECMFSLAPLGKASGSYGKNTCVDNWSTVLEEKVGERLMNDSWGAAFYDLSERVEKG